MKNAQAIKITVEPTERIQKLLNAHNKAIAGVGLERAIHYTDFFRKQAKRYQSKPMQMAMALKYHLQNRSVQIYENELVVGSHTEHRIGAICHIELAGFVMLEDIFRFAKRKVNPLYVDKSLLKKVIFRVFPYWMNRYLAMKAFSFWQKIKYILSQLKATQFIINEAGGIAHFLPNYPELLKLGTTGLRERVQRSIPQVLEQAKKDNLEAMLVTLDAMEEFAERYRNLARSLGRDDLILSLNIKQPAQSLQQALQTIWFFQMAIQIESLDQGISLGRIDQYLFSYYEQELRENGQERAMELFMAFFIKLSEVIPLFSNRLTRYFSGLPSGQAVTLGGMDEHGNCAANSLTALLLDIIPLLPLRQPNWHARINQHSQNWYKEQIACTLAKGTASPAVYNDDVIMPAMKKAGFPEQYLWNYATVGCVEPALPGISFTSSDSALVNIAYPLWQLMNNVTPSYRLSGKPIHPQELHSITDCNSLLLAYEALLNNLLDELGYCLNHIERANAREHPVPLSSLLIEKCIESGNDSTEGGAFFNASGIQAVGFANVVDSFYAIDRLVFQEKDISLIEFAKAVRKNFRGHEKLLQKIHSFPKYGNDHDDVDHFATRIASVYAKLLSHRVNTRGGKYIPGMYSMTCHHGFGQHLGALPSGRLAGAGLANGIAPSDGCDLGGPTASLNSVSVFSHLDYPNGVNLNLKLQTVGFDGEPLILQRLIEGYFQRNGMQLQLNMLNADKLLDAMKNPEANRNLLVRVSGYSAYFTDLSPEMQKEIVGRMNHKLR